MKLQTSQELKRENHRKRQPRITRLEPQSTLWVEMAGPVDQYSCLENPMDRGAWWVTVHGVQKLNTTERLNHQHYHLLRLSSYSEGLQELGWFEILFKAAHRSLDMG